MSLVQDDHVVQAFAADTPAQPFDVGVLPGSVAKFDFGAKSQIGGQEFNDLQMPTLSKKPHSTEFSGNVLSPSRLS
jgi:hypothetical protein